MEGVPDEMFQSDTQSFPREDPRITADLAKQHAQALKQQKAEDAEMAKTRKREEVQVKKALAIPTVMQRQDAVKHASRGVRERELTALKIRLYFKKLSHKISMKEPKTLPKDDAALLELLATVECELQSNGGIEQAGAMFVNGCFALEAVTQQFNPLGLMLSGPAASLTQTVAANKDKWDELITELAIANAEWFMMGPGKRCLLFVVQMVHTVDQANKAAVARGSSKPVPKEKEEAVADL